MPRKKAAKQKPKIKVTVENKDSDSVNIRDTTGMSKVKSKVVRTSSPKIQNKNQEEDQDGGDSQTSD